MVADKDRPLPKKHADLSGVRVAYSDVGSGEPILLVHGIPTSSYLWRNVVRALQDDYRLVAPDLMGLGDTETPLEHRYDMQAQADKLLELADHLGLERFTLVCHDQGGAAAQWLAVHHPERIARLIITNCVCYDNWPVPLVKRFGWLLSFDRLAAMSPRLDIASLWGKSRIGMRLGVHDPSAMSDDAIDEYLKFNRAGADRFEQFRRFVAAGDCTYSEQAAKRFGEFDRPTMVIWAAEDRWLSASWARRLYDDIAGACRFEVIPFAGHFFQEEKPRLCAGHIDAFMREIEPGS